jgi:hypothetical protein
MVGASGANAQQSGFGRTTGGPEGPPALHCSDDSGDYVINGMIRSATMFATLIIGLIAGPAVSL